MSFIFINLAFIIKTAVSQFTDAKLKNAKSVKNDMTNQQQNSDDIIDSFNMSDLLASLNKTSSSKTVKLSVLYQYLNHSHVNIQT